MSETTSTSATPKLSEESSASSARVSAVLSVAAPRDLIKDSARNMPTYRMTRDQFYAETDEESRAYLLREFNCAILLFLNLERSVYLEGLGILIPCLQTSNRLEIEDSELLVCPETRISIRFEKCNDLDSLHRDSFRNLAETKDLAAQLLPRLPSYCQVRFFGNNSEQENYCLRALQRLLRGLIDSIKHEVIGTGFSDALSPVGRLYALHNRQGSSMSEWYAGADIFVKARTNAVIKYGQTIRYERPVLRDAWELFEAAHGPASVVFRVDLSKQLAALGFQFSPHEPASVPLDRYMDVAVYKRNPSDRLKREQDSSCSLIFCTNGLRLHGLHAAVPQPIGNELVFQLNLAKNHPADLSETEWPQLAERVLTLGWMLMQGSKSKTVKACSGLSSDVALFGSYGASNMNTIFTSQFELQRYEQLSPEGPFTYTNLVVITEEEAHLGAEFGPQFLQSLLEYRHLDQVSSLARSSVCVRGHYKKNTEIETSSPASATLSSNHSQDQVSSSSAAS